MLILIALNRFTRLPRQSGHDFQGHFPLAALDLLVTRSRTNYHDPNPSRTLLARRDQLNLLLHQREGCLRPPGRGQRLQGPPRRGPGRPWAGHPLRRQRQPESLNDINITMSCAAQAMVSLVKIHRLRLIPSQAGLGPGGPGQPPAAASAVPCPCPGQGRQRPGSAAAVARTLRVV